MRDYISTSKAGKNINKRQTAKIVSEKAQEKWMQMSSLNKIKNKKINLLHQIEVEKNSKVQSFDIANSIKVIQAKINQQ